MYLRFSILSRLRSTTLFCNNLDKLIIVQKYIYMEITLFHIIIPTFIVSLNKKEDFDLVSEHVMQSEIGDGFDI